MEYCHSHIVMDLNNPRVDTCDYGHRHVLGTYVGKINGQLLNVPVIISLVVH